MGLGVCISDSCCGSADHASETKSIKISGSTAGRVTVTPRVRMIRLQQSPGVLTSSVHSYYMGTFTILVPRSQASESASVSVLGEGLHFSELPCGSVVPLGWQALAVLFCCLLGGRPGPSMRVSSKAPGLLSIIVWLSAAVASDWLIESAGKMSWVGNETGSLEHSAATLFLLPWETPGSNGHQRTC